MTDQQQRQVMATQEDIRGIKKDVAEMKDNIDIMRDALIGNPLSKDGGLIKRMLDAEVEIKKIGAIKRSNQIYLNLVWMCGGGFIMVVIDLLSKK